MIQKPVIIMAHLKAIKNGNERLFKVCNSKQRIKNINKNFDK